MGPNPPRRALRDMACGNAQPSESDDPSDHEPITPEQSRIDATERSEEERPHEWRSNAGS